MFTENFYIFIDGGSRMSKGIGAFSSVVLMNGLETDYIDQQLSYDKGFKDVTNNQMELLALVSSITRLYEAMYEQLSTAPEFDVKLHITVVSDSQYVIKGVNEYLPNWKINGYKTSARKPIKNKELWLLTEQLLEMFSNVEFEFIWTKGHESIVNGDYATIYNNMCDDNLNVVMNDIERGSITEGLDYTLYTTSLIESIDNLAEGSVSNAQW